MAVNKKYFAEPFQNMLSGVCQQLVVVNRAFWVGFESGSGLDFEKLSGFNRAGRRSEIKVFSKGASFHIKAA